MNLILPEPLALQLQAEAVRAAPAEACGLLVGERTGGLIRVSTLHPTLNVAADPLKRFEIDPAAHLALQRSLRGAGGHSILGCYHSHPGGIAAPSPRDRACACDDGWVWIIVATGVKTALAAFAAPRFTPLDIQI